MAFDFLPNGIDQIAMGNTCYGCGDPHRKDVRAFRAPAFEDFLGQIEICERCVRKMADTLGLMPKEKHEQVKETNQRLLQEKKDLQVEIDALREARERDQELHASEVADLRVKAEKVRAGAQ